MHIYPHSNRKPARPFMLSDETAQTALIALSETIQNCEYMASQYENESHNRDIDYDHMVNLRRLADDLQQWADQLHDAHDDLLYEYNQSNSNGQYNIGQRTFEHIFERVRDKRESADLFAKAMRKLADEQDTTSDLTPDIQHHQQNFEQYDQAFNELFEIHKTFPYDQ